MKTHPYKILGVGMGIIGAIFVGFMLVGILLPSGWEVERSVEIAAPPERIFAFVNSAARWEEWTIGPETGMELFGPAQGVGSGHRWDDPSYGQGEFVITESDPPSELRYEVAIEGGAIRIEGAMALQATGSGTELRWREVGDFGWNPILGYLAGRMSDLQGDQLDASLSLLADAVRRAEEASPPASGEPEPAMTPSG